MKEFTDEEVFHIAHLSKIYVREDEMDKYKKELKMLMNEIQKINDVKLDNDDIMISPSENTNVYRDDISNDVDVDILSNAPRTNGNYIEIKRFVND